MQNSKNISKGIKITSTADHRDTEMNSLDRPSEQSHGKFTANVNIKCLSHLFT